MNLITYFSRVAEQDFKTVTEVRDYFIKKEFLELLGSTDLDFAVSLVSAVNVEASGGLAPDMYNLLMGLPTTYGLKYGTLATKVNSARLLFLSSPKLKLDPETGEIETSGKLEVTKNYIKNKMRHLENVNSYLTNRVLSDVGKSQINKFIIDSNDVAGRVVIGKIELPVNKYLLATLLLTSLSVTKREGKSRFSPEQFKLLKHNLLRYTRCTGKPSEGKELLLPRQIDVEMKKYNRASRGYDEVDLFPLKEIYRNLFTAIDDSNTARTYNLCLLLGAYRRYSVYKAMFTEN